MQMAKEEFLRRFHLNEKPDELFEGAPIGMVSDDVLDLLKENGLTVDQAFAVLQRTYDQIKYESNFLKL